MEYLQERFTAVCNRDGGIAVQSLEFRQPLTKWEAHFIFKGMSEGVFRIDDTGYVQSPLLPASKEGSGTQQRMIQIFWHFGDGKRRLFREGLCQIATACRLIYEFGWGIHDVKMEPTVAEFGSLAYGIDILTLGYENSIPLCCEVKKGEREFQRLIKDFHACCAAGGHRKEDCQNKANHPKYEFCARAKPIYCWFVAPTNERFYKLFHANNERIELTELPYPLGKKEILA